MLFGLGVIGGIKGPDFGFNALNHGNGGTEIEENGEQNGGKINGGTNREKIDIGGQTVINEGSG